MPVRPAALSPAWIPSPKELVTNTTYLRLGLALSVVTVVGTICPADTWGRDTSRVFTEHPGHLEFNVLVIDFATASSSEYAGTSTINTPPFPWDLSMT